MPGGAVLTNVDDSARSRMRGIGKSLRLNDQPMHFTTKKSGMLGDDGGSPQKYVCRETPATSRLLETIAVPCRPPASHLRRMRLPRHRKSILTQPRRPAH